eukprot:TRINITY_DN1051_c0_g1_i1.p1 TRINITY_DN1051_c0_g1~~TRINITY_DN1051_c0_g1_i1.p1  ORF type:complete len:327 (-),score=74.43 TRINITY_DN1051_c0_g1_i1:530-1510(-)
MGVLKGEWIRAKQGDGGPLARSSHAVAVVGKKAYVFGGEFEPRVPVDNKLYVFDLENMTWSVSDAKGDVPPPRIGVTMASVGSVIYLFGGRDAEHRELNQFYSFDTVGCTWTLISEEDSSPPHRSYHAMAADKKAVYVFGGCGKAGRLNDLWEYNTEESKWKALPSGPPTLLPRGGAGLLVAANKVWVIFGFGGKHELSDIHSFDLATGTWQLVETSGEKPSPRSVFSCFALNKYLVVYGGEVDPSDKGHLGAGSFSSEVFALDIDMLTWQRVDDVAVDTHPGPRGWTAYSPFEYDGTVGMLVYGGNSPSNDRLDDINFFKLCITT